MSDEGGGHDERWVISYADLVTLLLGFFIILYSTAELDVARFEQLRFAFADAFNVDVRQGQNGESPFFDGGSGIVSGGSIGLPDPQLDLIKARVERELQDSGFALGTIVVGRQQDDIVIRLADHLLFPSASAELQPEARELMQVVADVLQTVPNAVRVEGHTDNVPVGTAAYPTNWELSSARATAVLRALVDAGVSPVRLSAAGYAEFRPVASNNTPEGRAQNRRADIVIISPQDGSSSSVPSTPDATGTEAPSQAPQEGTPGE
ncbi:MAG: OmpA family protein [Dehalococcoidia bacterium]